MPKTRVPKQHITLPELERKIVKEFSTYRQRLARHRDVVNRALAVSQDSYLLKRPHRTVGIINRVISGVNRNIIDELERKSELDQMVTMLQNLKQLNASLRQWYKTGFPIAWYNDQNMELLRLIEWWLRKGQTFMGYSIFPPEGIRNILRVSKRTDYLTIAKKLLKESGLEPAVQMTVAALRQ